jgi:hypothetical protein
MDTVSWALAAVLMDRQKGHHLGDYRTYLIIIHTEHDKITQCCKRKYTYGHSILGSSSSTLGKLESILSLSSSTHGCTGWVVHLNYFSMILCPYKLCLFFLSLIIFSPIVPLNLFKITTSDFVQHALPWGQSYHISTSVTLHVSIELCLTKCLLEKFKRQNNSVHHQKYYITGRCQKPYFIELFKKYNILSFVNEYLFSLLGFVIEDIEQCQIHFSNMQYKY